MTQTQGSLARQITDYAHRADPYPIYAELRKTPVVHDEEGPYIVSTYWEIHGLLHDPRLSSEARDLDPEATPELVEEDDPGLPPSFLRLDPPEHDRLRRLAMAPFGPPHTPRRLHAMRGELTRIVGELIDGFEGRDRIDLVDHFSYPFPVTVICGCSGCRGRTSRASTPGPRPSPSVWTPTRTRTPPSGGGSPGRPVRNWRCTCPS